MRKYKPNPLSHPAGHVMKINGKIVHITTARYSFRCAECLGGLVYRGAGVGCESNPAHRRFVHKKEAAATEAVRAETTAALMGVYEIKDGKLVVREII